LPISNFYNAKLQVNEKATNALLPKTIFKYCDTFFLNFSKKQALKSHKNEKLYHFVFGNGTVSNRLKLANLLKGLVKMAI